MNDVQDILHDIKQAVTTVDANAEVILFGSRARGDFNEESDWDLLVLVDKPQDDRLYKRSIRHALLNLELQYGITITALIRNRKSWREMSVTPFFKEVQKDECCYE